MIYSNPIKLSMESPDGTKLFAELPHDSSAEEVLRVVKNFMRILTYSEELINETMLEMAKEALSEQD